jgi:RimJ/RimL family protein N-acetyltransferase
VKRWYVALSDADVVLYGWYTSPARRGRGLVRHGIAAAVRAFSPGATRFLADVRVWNRPSIQVMERMGFECVAKARPRA